MSLPCLKRCRGTGEERRRCLSRCPEVGCRVRPCRLLPWHRRGNACRCLPSPAPLEGNCPAPVSRCAGGGSIPGARWRWKSCFPPCGAEVSPLGGQSSLRQEARLQGLFFGSVGPDFQVEFLDESKKGKKKTKKPPSCPLHPLGCRALLSQGFRVPLLPWFSQGRLLLPHQPVEHQIISKHSLPGRSPLRYLASRA